MTHAYWGTILSVDDSVARIQLAPSLAKFIADVNGVA